MAIRITYQIPGVPLLDQRKEASNPTYDCVFESNAAMATAYLGKPFTGTQIKAMDSNYGPGYTGGADEQFLVDTMAKLGIKVAAVQHDTQEELVDELQWQIIHYQHACLVTMPSQWNSAVTAAGSAWNPRTYTGPSHVGLACGVGVETTTGEKAIRVMNPWGGFWQDGTNSYWAARLLKGAIWVGQLAKAPQPTETPEQQVIRFYHELQADRAQIGTLKQQNAALQEQSRKQYDEIVSLRSQLATALANAGDPKAKALLEALRAALAA